MTAAARRAAAAATVVVLTAVLGACARPASERQPTDQAPAIAPTARTMDVSAYVVPWDDRSTAGLSGRGLREISPVWLVPTDTGAITFAPDVTATGTATLASAAATDGLTLAPSISNYRGGRWDGALIAGLVSDPVLRAAHVQAITDLVRQHGWPAIDVDYESLPAGARSGFSAFVADLARSLHSVPARLSVTVHAKTSEPGSWSGARAQDWRALGAAADQVRVMAYDYADAASHPGPIAPAAWVSQVVRLAVDRIPRDRIAVGLPTYGYDWPAGASGQAVQWADAEALRRKADASRHWDAASAAPWFAYTDNAGRSHTVWYENAASLAAKLRVIDQFQLAHVVLWRLGGEDPAIWPILNRPR